MTFANGNNDGDSLGSLSINLTTQVALRDICLTEVNTWIASERKARDTGKPGA